MKILIIGGTVFLGRHLIDAALAHGHEVTIFNRGLKDVPVPDGVEILRGDRETDLDVLRGRSWDAAFDTCGYTPSAVGASTRLLADAVEHYTFVSTGSVYANTSTPGVHEDSPVGTMTDEQVRDIEGVKPEAGGIIARSYGEFYGPLKARCERAAEEAMPGRVLVVRSGLIVGPFDYSDRFTYWPRRVAEGGDVLAPGNPETQLQFIDVRDMSDWIVRMAEARKAGTYNVTGPEYVLTWKRFLDECREATASDARFVWVGEEFLIEKGVEAWSELPLWVPESDETNRYFLGVSVEKALQEGLTFRPLRETIRDTLAWDNSRPAETERRAGLKIEKELEVLEAWAEKK